MWGLIFFFFFTTSRIFCWLFVCFFPLEPHYLPPNSCWIEFIVITFFSIGTLWLCKARSSLCFTPRHLFLFPLEKWTWTSRCTQSVIWAAEFPAPVLGNSSWFCASPSPQRKEGDISNQWTMNVVKHPFGVFTAKPWRDSVFSHLNRQFWDSKCSMNPTTSPAI